MSEIQWEQPPPENRGRRAGSKWDDFAAALRSRPGEWALMTDSGDNSMVNRVKKGAPSAFQPEGSFEATGRKQPGTSRYKVWARYIGENGEFK